MYYDWSFKNKKHDFLNQTIIAYSLNVFHYFVLSLDKGIDYCLDGIQYCIDKKIPFIKDSFGKTPLDYAKNS
jgi:hypothetical protein